MKNEGKKRRTVKIVLIVVAAVIVAGAGAFAAGAAGYEKGLETAELKNAVSNEVIEYNHNINEAAASEAGDIGLEKAKAIALSQVNGAAEANIIKSSRDYDDGRLEYEIDIKYNGYEYDFNIDAASGQIIGSEVERAEWI